MHRNYLQTHTYLLPQERERLRRAARQRGVSAAALLRSALLRELDGPNVESSPDPRPRRQGALTA